MPDVVMIVDMIRGFLEEGNPLYCGETARRIIPSVQKLLAGEIARDARLLFLCDNHDPDDLEFKMFPRHCVAGTPETELIPELAGYAGDMIPKKRYSGFYGTDLDQRLKALSPDKIIVCGVCTDICVCHTVADCRNRDYLVEVPANCVASFDEDAHEFALQHMEKILGATVTRE